MLVLLPILLLLLTASLMFTLSRLRRAFNYFWLLAAAGAFLAWIGTWSQRLILPTEFTLLNWRPQSLFRASPALRLDASSWAFALALSTLGLAVILTSLARNKDANWGAWAGSILLTAVGLLAVLAGNPLTLALAWTLIDLIELLLLLPRLQGEAQRRNLLIYFTTSLLGTMVFLWAQVAASSAGEILSFDAVPASVGLYLLIAVGLRVGILPLQVLTIEDVPLRRGMGTLLRLVPAAASLLLIVRISIAGLPGPLISILLVLILLPALYGAAFWLRASDEIAGRPYWILALASLAFAAALRGNAAAAQAWSLALLYLGGMAFLTSLRDRRLLPLALLGLLSLTALPFTPSSAGAGLYEPFALLVPGYLLAQSLLMLGFARHTLRSEGIPARIERWVWVVYPLGLALPSLTYWLHFFASSPLNALLADGLLWWPPIFAAGLALLLSLVSRSGRLSLSPDLFVAIDSFFSLDWLYRLIWWLSRSLARLLSVPTALLEGQGGVLWTLLFVALLLSLLVQFGPAG